MFFYSDEGDEEMCREKYINILKLCLKHCKYFSLEFLGETPRYPDLEKFILAYEVSPAGKHVNTVFADKVLVLYEYNDEAYKILSSEKHSMFTWVSCWAYSNPENLTFYRADGSLFLETITHEGHCAIFERPGEDVSSIVDEEWLDESHKYDILNGVGSRGPWQWGAKDEK